MFIDAKVVLNVKSRLKRLIGTEDTHYEPNLQYKKEDHDFRQAVIRFFLSQMNYFFLFKITDKIKLQTFI